MYKKVWKASFIAGAMMISTSSFAELVVDKKVGGKAELTKRNGGGRTLSCTGDRGTCYTLYTSGDMIIHHRDGDIICHPGLHQPPPVLIPDPAEPDTYRQVGSIDVELLPGQEWPGGN